MLKTKKQIIEWLDDMSIYGATVMPDLTVNVQGNVFFTGKLGDETELPIQFGTVTGDFNCSKNKLTTLKGSPIEVYGHFDCCYNHLTNLLDGPKIAKKNYNCSSNKLTTLEGAPNIVPQIFSCSENQLTSLEYAPQEVGQLDCYVNKLTSLDYVPQKIEVGINFSRNQITSLKGLPSKIGNIYASHNPLQIDDWLDIQVTNQFEHSSSETPNDSKIKLFSQYYKPYGMLAITGSIFNAQMQTLYYLEEKRQLEKSLNTNAVNAKRIKL